jgi:hypothetical protein
VSPFAEADRLLRLIVSQRGACERCGGVGSQVAHVIRRRYTAVRCDERNAWWLCPGCHFVVDNYALEHVRFVEETIGAEALAGLLSRAHAGPPEPQSIWAATERARLRDRCRELGIPMRGAA